MHRYSLQALTLAVGLALASPAVSFAAEPAPAAQVEPAAPPVAMASTRTDDASLAQREQQAQDLKQFEGGQEVVVVSTTTTILVLLIVLLILL